MCAAQGIQADDTSHHRAVSCPLTGVVHRLVWARWDDVAGSNSTWLAPLLTRNPPLRLVPGSDAIPPNRDLTRALTLGLRPEGERDRPEGFALVRGLVITELAEASRTAWRAQQAGLQPEAADLYRCAAAVYHRIRVQLQEALQGEWEKLKLVQRRLRAAGCELPSPPPTDRWKQQWAWLIDDARQQQLLPEQPPWGVLCVGIDADRLAPRPDWAPPTQLPPRFICAYTAGSPDGKAWALVAVQGHDAMGDSAAPLIREAGGPVVTDTNAPQFTEATSCSNWQATLCAVTECFRLVSEGAFGQLPILIRVEEQWAPAIAGIVAERDDGKKLARHVQKLHAQCRTSRDVWLTACRQGRGQWWADRAVAIARQCADATWGQPSAVWQPMPTLPSLRGATDQCPICLDDFTDALPRPRQPLARAPETFHACGRHAACIACDRRNPDHRCCICRSARHPWVVLP